MQYDYEESFRKNKICTDVRKGRICQVNSNNLQR